MRTLLDLFLGWGAETIPVSLCIDKVLGVQECQMQYSNSKMQDINRVITLHYPVNKSIGFI